MLKLITQHFMNVNHRQLIVAKAGLVKLQEPGGALLYVQGHFVFLLYADCGMQTPH